MCGIVGIVGKRKSLFYGAHLDLFEEMLWCDAIRGKDSTGAFTVLANSQAKLVKNEGNPEYLLGTKQWEKFRQAATQSGHILVGHNRKATFGTVSRENAHPFCEENILLVHNGTVANHKGMKDVEVDSHAICHSIAEKGHVETLEQLDGAFTLVWYDITNKKLNLVRNDQRPLVWTENQDFLFFASEGFMLGWLLARNNIKTEKFYDLSPMELFSFSFTPYAVSKEKITKKVTSVVHRTWQGWCAGDDPEGAWWDQGTTPETPVTTIIPKTNTLLDKYNVGDEIVFRPKTMFEDTVMPGRWKIRGSGYIPGLPLLPNVTWLAPVNVEFDDAMELNQEDKLIGRIRNISADHSGIVMVYLENAKTDVLLNTWNNDEIPSWEWEYIAQHFTCAKCGQPLNGNQNRATSVLTTKEGEPPRCVCPKCIAENLSCIAENLSSMPKDKQDAFEQASDPAV